MNRNSLGCGLRLKRWAALAVCLLGLLPGDAEAQTRGLGGTTQVRLPENLADSNGYTVSVTMHDPLSYGYVTVDIAIDSSAAWTAQRQFVLRLIPTEDHLPSRNAATIDIPVSAEQGKRRSAITRRIPKWTIGETYEVRLIEDGQTVENYVGEIGGPLPTKNTRDGYPLHDDRYCNVLAIDQPPPAKRVVGYGAYPGLNPASIQELPIDWRDYRAVDAVMISNAELEKIPSLGDGAVFESFRQWIMMGGTVVVTGKSNADALSDTLDFRVLVDTNSTDFLRGRVARQLNAASKQLSGVQEFSKKASALRRLVDQMLRERGIDPRTVLPQAFSDGTPNPDAIKPQPNASVDESEDGGSDIEMEVSAFGGPTSLREGFDYEELKARFNKELGIKPKQPSSRIPNLGMAIDADFYSDVMMPLNYSPPFIVEVDDLGAALPRSIDDAKEFVQEASGFIQAQRALGDRLRAAQVAAGLIIWQVDAPELTSMEMIAVNETIGGRVSHAFRRGVDPLLGDSRAVRWMIPGVAQPPVYTFMGLLGLFVVLVGPVAYRQTSKAKRSYLMFAIAPILALVTTVAMIGYSVTADGFGTITRVRQMTWVDGRSGDSVERIRSTYFAGVRPADGLRFSGDAEVMPYRLNVDDTWEEVETDVKEIRHEITVGEDYLRLGQSYMPSRSQQQFVAHQPRESAGAIWLVGLEESGAAPPPRLTSTFGFPLRKLVLCDDNENYWGCDEVPANAKDVELIALGDVESRTQLGDLYNDFRPEGSVNRADANRNNRRRGGYSYGRRQETKDLIQAISRLNDVAGTAMTDGLFENWLQRNLLISSTLPPNHFIAISDVSDDVLAVPDAEVVNSVRYVFGSMR